MTRAFAFAAGVVIATGCVVNDEADLAETQFELAKPGGCPPYGCGVAGPKIEGISFTTLNEIGVANPQNLRIQSFVAKVGNTWMTLTPDVFKGELVGKKNGLIAVSGLQLANAKFMLEHTVTHALYRVDVAEVGTAELWNHTSSVPKTGYTYKLEYVERATGLRSNLCATYPAFDQFPNLAVLLDDEQIDEDKLVVKPPVPNQFMIGCEGSVLYKLWGSINTGTSSAIAGIPSSLNKRTAALKMFTADYCGSGSPLATGEDIVTFRDSQNIAGVLYKEIEAEWTEKGASCLNVARVAKYPSPLAQLVFPNLPVQMGAYCPPPPACKLTKFGDPKAYPFGDAEFVSGWN